MVCHFLLQGIFPTQGWNASLLHFRQKLYHLKPFKNGLNAPTKRHRLAEWIQKQDPYICCLQETHFRPQDTYRLKVRGWKNTFHANRKQKKAGVAIFIADKIDLKEDYKRKGRTLHNDQGINPRGRHNNCKYLCTQHRSTSIHKINTNRHQRRSGQ